ncbi:MAG: V-type ATP synthase subunit F, partial [Ruminococcus sp.]|nr:V-type ATP synthase subunit F [Ruminococcus sp.]
MKMYLISDNVDTLMGMRLAGVDGVVVHKPHHVKKALDDALNMKDVAVILMTETLMKLCYDKVYDIKLH